jgi:hypothetical protein
MIFGFSLFIFHDFLMSLMFLIFSAINRLFILYSKYYWKQYIKKMYELLFKVLF